MRERERREGGPAWGGGPRGARGPRVGQAGPGRARLGCAGLGCTAGQNPAARTTTDRNPNAKQNPQ
jgi:hypothetical protein